MASHSGTFAADLQVAELIRIARLTQGLSRREVAEAIRVTTQQLQKYEDGTNRISIGRLHALANILGVPMSAFLQGLDVNTSTGCSGADARAVNAALKTEEGVRIAAALSQVKDKAIRRHIAHLLEAIIEAEREVVPPQTESRTNVAEA